MQTRSLLLALSLGLAAPAAAQHAPPSAPEPGARLRVFAPERAPSRCVGSLETLTPDSVVLLTHRGARCAYPRAAPLRVEQSLGAEPAGMVVLRRSMAGAGIGVVAGLLLANCPGSCGDGYGGGLAPAFAGVLGASGALLGALWGLAFPVEEWAPLPGVP